MALLLRTVSLLPQVRGLLAAGADPSLADRTSVTPLIAAAGGGHLGAVRMLCSRGVYLGYRL
jgi:hypothetical protein